MSAIGPNGAQAFTVGELKRVLALVRDDAIVTVQCEHDGYVRFDHIAESAFVSQYEGVSILRLMSDPAFQLVDLFEREPR